MNQKHHYLLPIFRFKKILLAFFYCLVTQFSYAALSGTYTINPGGAASATNYKTIKSAISDLTLGTRTDGGTPNGAGVTGAVIFELSSTYTSSSETFPLTFGAITGVSSSYSITVRPASNVSSVLTISGSNTTAIFLMDGCENIIFDGRPGGVGNNLYLNISNLSSSGVAISYLNDASFNTVKYCTLRGVNPTSNKGVVIFGSTTGTTGNDSNTIDNCHIRDGLTTPLNGITSQGTLDKENTGNIISNNHIYNFFTTGAGANGINLNLYNEGWTIIGNHIYQTATRTPTSSNPYRGIAVVGGGGHLISSNSIGGSAANTGGSAWTHNASTAHSFGGIYLSVDTGVATSVQGNTIANFSFTFANANSSTSGIWNGIIISAGKVNVGTITGNTIGDTSTGSINVISSLTGGAVMGIRTSSTAMVNISNNSIGSINASGSSASISCSIYGISIGGRCLNVSNNIIGNVSAANSLNAITSSNSTTGQFVVGIHNTSSQNLPINITNNIIANLNNNYIGAATNGQVVGISSSNGVNTITGNTIYNLSTSSKNPNNVATSILGISITSSNGANGSQSVSQNLIHTLTNTTDTAAVRVLGIYASCPTSGTHYLSKNFIHSLNLSSSNANCVLAGIQIFQGTGTIIQNNMIRLGINASGNSITKGCNIYGIYQNGGNNLNFYHNSVYIGGSGVISVGNTAAFYRIVSGFAMKLYNNVLVNARSNSSGSAYNAALWLTAPTDYTAISSNNNILYAPGIGGTVGLQQTNAYTTLPLWQEISKLDSNSGSGNPGFVNPTGNATLVDLHISGNSPVESFGRIGLTVTDDFDGNLRDSLTVDIGADAGNFTAVDAFFPFIGFTPINDLISSTANLSLAVSITDIGLGVPTSGSNRPRIWFRRLAPATSAWISTQGTFNSGNANNGNWTFNLNYSSLGITPTIGETYEYYLVAQDQVSTPNLRSNPLIGASHTDVNTQVQAPTSPHSFSIVAPLATTINVGSGQTFTTLTGNGGVFEIINNAGLNGNTVVNITSDLIEDGTHSLKGTGLNSFTLTIQPNKDSIRTISNNGNLAVSMLRLEGVNGVTIDGRNGGIGRYFRIINTHTTPASCKAAIEIFGSSTNSFIRNCIIESNSTSTNLGNIFLGIGANTGIGIRNNDIRDAQGAPGTLGIPRILMYSFSDKNVVSIEDNNLHNFTQSGINLSSVGNGCSVSGNSVYYDASTIPNTAQVGIAVSRGDSQTIVGNFIGGQSPNCGDSAWTNNGNVTFTGIQVSLGSAIASLVKGNVIQNIRLTGTASSNFYGISSFFGLVNMDSNLVGHPSTANSIYCAGGTVSGSTQNVGILNTSNMLNVTSVVSNNTVANITNSTSNSNVNAYLMGIYSNVTTSNNTIFNISSNAATSVTTSAPVGIFNSGATSSQSVNNNIIYNLSNTNTTAVSPAVNGIVADGVLSNFITNNRIYGLSNSATGVTPAINGILNNNNVNLTIANNQISLTNDTNTNSVVISGIQCTFTTGNILYNSIYIGGSGNSKSYGFLRLTSYAVTLRNNLLYNERSGASGNHYAIGNNFATPATGWSSSASNNNLYVVSNLNKMGEWGGFSQTLAQWNSSSAGDSNSVVQLNSTIPSSSFFTGVSANPINLGISNSSQVYVKDLGTPISATTTDYNGNPRPTSTTSIGAFEYSVSSSSNNANLIAMLLSSGTLNPTFDSLQTSYTSSVVNSISSITLTPTKSQANATIEIRVNGGTYASVTSGTASGSLALNVGSNTIDVRVTAQNGTTQKIYTVTITRAAGLSDNANLIAMLLSSGSLNPTFDSLQTSYTSSVVNSISSITLTPTKSQANATIEIRVNGGTYASVNSGTASGSLALNVGPNTINVRVTAQNETTQKIYTVTITRAGVVLSDNANLIAMLLSSGTLNPSFDSLQTSYTSSVVNSISSITLTPTKSQANATIEIRVNGGTYASVTSGTASGSFALNVGPNTINVRVTAQNETTQKIYTVTVTRAASNPDPIITINGTLDTFSSCSGTVSFVDSFAVSGSNLAANITILAPTGFEISTTAASGFTNNLNLPQSSGSVASTKIYVRLSSSATGTPSGSIVLYSSGDNSEVLAVTGIVNVLPSITLGTISSVFTTATTFNLPFTSGAGSPNQYTILAGTPNAMSSFTSVNNSSLVSSPILVSIPASAANMYNFNLTVKNTTTGCISNNIPFTLSVGNPSISNNIISGNQLICSGSTPTSLVGSSPEGGNNSYTYSWIKSTSTASSGYTTATGSNNLQNYLPPVLAQNTWFKRIVNSGTYSDTSNVVLVSLGDTSKPIARPRNLIAYLNNTGILNLTGAQVDSASFDNCGIQSKTLSKSSFNCSNIGSNQVCLIITDAIGNKDSALSTITVLDTVRPVVVTQNRTVYLSAAGTATVSALQLNNGTSDACGVASLSASQTSYTCANVGTPVTVTLTATDLNGNSNTGTATVTVLDTVRPVVVTQNRTVYLSAAGTATLSALQLNNGTSDACGVASLSASQTSYTCANVGTPVTVTLTATDLNGNSNTGTATVTVLDTIRPLVNTQNRTIYLSVAGTATVSAGQVNNGSSDACGVAALSLSQTNFTCANVGTPVTVTLTVTDVNGNSNTGTATITVLDTIRPIVVTQNISVQLNAAGSVTITGSQINNGSSDICGIATTTVSPSTFTCSNIGTNTVILTVTDINGNVKTGTATVTVADTVRPVVTTQNITLQLNNIGTASLTAAQVNNGSSDACGIATMTVSPNSFTCSNTGANTVTLTVTDLNGNVKTGTAIVTVADTVRPTVISQNLTAHLNASGTASITAAQVNNGSTDACGIATVSVSPSSFTCSNIGANTVTLTVTDNKGNVKTGTATVTIADTIRPVVVTQNITVQLNNLGTVTIVGTQVNNGSTDICGIASYSVSPNTFTCSNTGANTVTLTVTDVNGNVKTGTAIVTVADTVRPVVVTQNITVQLSTLGAASITAAQINNGSTDACGIATTTVSPSSFTCSNVGANTVTLTVTDNKGNVKTGTAVVMVADTVRPVVVTQNRTIYLNNLGAASITAAQVNNGSSDACGIASTTLFPTSFTCSNVGANTVTLTVTDNNGNVKTGTATVTVLDTINPTVNMVTGIVLYLDQSGSVGISASQFNNGSSDVCGIASVVVSPTTITCADLGIKTVTLTVTDVNGNVGVGTTTVVVFDPVAPVARPKAAFTAYLSNNGQAIINAGLLDSASSDNCTITSRVLGQSVFNCSNTGANNVNFTVQDQSGNSHSANVVVTILDTIRPVAVVSNQSVYLNALGTGSITATQVNNNSTDNCGVSTTSINKSTFTCSDLGTSNIIFTVTDINSNSKTANVAINVFDTIRPIMRPKQNINVYLNATGTASITVTDADSVSTDNCSIATRTLSQSTFTCSNVGVNTVTLNGTDITGNIGSRTFTVTLLDTVKPLLTTKPASIYVTSNGTATLSASQVILSSSDNCSSGLTNSLSQSNFTCTNLGSNNVSVTVTDASGNFRTLNAVVTVIDTIKPIVVTQSKTIYLNASGTASLTAAQVNNGTTDNCNIQSLSISKTSYTAADLGINNITFTATDNSSNSQIVNVIITVLDTVRPTVVTQNRTIYLNSTGNASITASQVNNGSSDNVGITSLLLSKSAFTCSDLGTNLVNLTATDISNNSTSASATITVSDTMRPIVVSQNLTLYLNGLGTVSITPQQVNNGSTDNCSIASYSLSKSTFNCTDRGINSNIITLSVIDGSGNIATAFATISVLDTMRPNVVVNNNLNIYLNGSGTATLTTTQVNNGSTDNCGITSLVLGKTSFNSTNLGLNIVSFTATDASGNFLTVNINVNVLDSTMPIAITQNRTIYLNSTGNASITAAQVNNGSSDNVGITSLLLSKSAFTCSDLGTNLVNLTATDISNNSTSASATITVSDTMRPIAVSQNLTLYLNGLGTVSITPQQVNNGSTDNCSIASYSLSKSTFNCTDRGINSNIITLSVIDGSGNIATAFATISVLDTMRPNVVVNNNLNIYLNGSGTATLTTTQVNNGSTDNCGITSLVLGKTSFNSTNLGLNIVSFTATDASGNFLTVNINVNVLDSTMPIAIAQNRTIYLNASGAASITAAQVNNGSSDNVGVTTLTLSKTTFGCNDVGNNTVTLTVKDISNNTATANAIITVLDTMRPYVNAQNLTVYLNGLGQAAITTAQANDGSTDNCGITNLSLSKSTFDCSDRGVNSNTVTLSATDASANVSNTTFNVSVLDTMRPNVIINNNLNLYLDANGTVTLSPGQVNNGSTDNCGITTLALGKTNFNGTNLGLNIISFTATDASGNSHLVYVNVIVNDTMVPIVIGRNKTIYLSSTGSAVLTPNDVDNGSTDNVGITTRTVNKTLFNCNDAGLNLIELFVGDISGNRSSTIVTVTVLDTIVPVVSNLPANITLGYCGADYRPNLPTATDNCGDVIIKQTAGVTPGNKYPVGVTTNIFTFEDKSGNLVTRSFTVTVTPKYVPDTLPNITICSSVQPFALTPANAKGVYTFSGSGVTLDGKMFDPSLSGSGNYNVTYTFVDSSLCATQGNFFVTVNRAPDKPVIVRKTSVVLQVEQQFNFYQWLRYGQPIAGATSQSYTTTRSGLYSVKVSTKEGCTTESDPYALGVNIGVNNVNTQIGFKMYPNPSNGLIYIELDDQNVKGTNVKVFDALGKLVYETDINTFITQLDLSNIADGTYFVRLTQEGKTSVKPIVITK